MGGVEDRYLRQLALKEIGSKGQEKLRRASALIVGCGALGSVQAQLLVRMGVGRVRIVDRDVPQVNNLHRQILFDEPDVAAGLPKAEVAARKLAQVNSQATIEGVVEDVTVDNIERLLNGVDVVLDATDNFETRYLINDACVKNGKPWIYGGVVGTSGMLLTILPGKGACLRCIFPEPPPPGSLPTIESEGVLSTAPMTVAAIQVTEAIKILVGSEAPSGLLMIDVWSASFRAVPVLRDQSCPVCGWIA